MVELLVLVWSGHGTNYSSFPSHWYYTFNFKTAEGAGAFVVFAAVVLYKCRHYLLCCFRPSTVADLEDGERQELKISSFLFVTASIGVVLILWQGIGAHLFYAVLMFLVILVITIGLTRAVTEGGLLGFQAWCSPFHFIRSLVGMNKAWTAPSLFAPLLVYYAIMFLDLKTFIAPAMANSIKIRDDAGMKRTRFHMAIWGAIVLAMGAAVVFHLMLAYSEGADSMHGWFYTNLPRDVFDKVGTMIQTNPVDTQGHAWWILGGALAMGLLLYFRQMVFWLPHPIGLLMLVSPLMGAYWFSILLGWAAKALVTKFGNVRNYRHVRAFFIGLIVGELFLVILNIILSYFFDGVPGSIVVLNRQ